MYADRTGLYPMLEVIADEFRFVRYSHRVYYQCISFICGYAGAGGIVGG